MKKLTFLLVMLLSIVFTQGQQLEISHIVSYNHQHDSVPGVCIGELIIVEPTVNYGEGNYVFKWSSIPEGFNGIGMVAVDHPTETTTYIVEVSDGVNTVSESITVIVYQEIIVYDLLKEVNCIDDITIFLSDSDTGNFYQLYVYENETFDNVTGWIPGNGTSLSFGSFSSGDYNYSVFNGGQWGNTPFGCRYGGLDPINIDDNLGDSICLVTVDTITNKNMVVFQTSENDKISHHNIYREFVDGFELIGSVPYNSNDSVVVYLDNTSNPIQRSYNYKISVVDICDNELIDYKSHKTIHLNISLGIDSYNLQWSEYFGVDFSRYYIYRKTVSDFVLIDSVPKNVFSYTDINPPEGVNYMIGVDNEDGCVYEINSNIKSGTLGVNGINMNTYKVYPNPTTSIVKIEGLSGEEIFLSNMYGQVLLHDIGINEINLNSFPNGMYILNIKKETDYYLYKVIKN